MLSDRDGEMVSNLRCVRKGKKDRPLWQVQCGKRKQNGRMTSRKPGFLPLDCKMDGVAIPHVYSWGKNW